MNNVLELLSNVDELTDSVIQDVDKKLNEFKVVAGKFKRRNDNKIELGFNIFNIISKSYHKENFHSDILNAFLEIPEFREEFLNLIQLKKKSIVIKTKDYLESSVEREKGRIDILIKSLTYDKAIIIESKINNAKDTYRQLPKYSEYLKKKNTEIIIDAIIYLSMDGKKEPNKGDWTKAEIKTINQKLIKLALYDESNADLYYFLGQCEDISADIDVLLLLRQYKQLIKFLGQNIINMELMNEFYKIMLDQEKFETAQSTAEMFSELEKFRSHKFKKHFESNFGPFGKVDVWTERKTYYITYFADLIFRGLDIRLDVAIKKDMSVVSIRGDKAINNTDILKLTQELEFEFEEKNDNRVYKYFKFPKQENELYLFVESFNKKLDTLIKSNSLVLN